MPDDTAPPPDGHPANERSREEELESALADRERQLLSLRRRLVEREAFIAEVLGSRSWRIARLVQEVRNRLVPKG